MAAIIPGTGALIIQRVGTLRSRPTWSLPSLATTRDEQPNHLIVVTGEAKGAGRNGYMNFLASTLTRMSLPFALVEFAPSLGSAARAHQAEGVSAELVSPLKTDWHIALVDKVDQQFDRAVILGVQSDVWLAFATVEAALLASIGRSRPVAYVFVDPSNDAKRLHGHLKWLEQSNLPRFPHRVASRGAPLYPRQPTLTPGYHSHTVVPHFAPQVAAAVFGQNRPPGSAWQPATFHAAFDKATTGSKAVMFEPVAKAMRDVAELLEDASFHLRQGVG